VNDEKIPIKLILKNGMVLDVGYFGSDHFEMITEEINSNKIFVFDKAVVKASEIAAIVQ